MPTSIWRPDGSSWPSPRPLAPRSPICTPLPEREYVTEKEAHSFATQIDQEEEKEGKSNKEGTTKETEHDARSEREATASNQESKNGKRPCRERREHRGTLQNSRKTINSVPEESTTYNKKKSAHNQGE